MKPRWLIGSVAMLLLATPAIAQHGGSGGFAASGARAAGSYNAGAVPRAATMRPIAANLPRGSSAAGALANQASLYPAAGPSRHAAFSSARRNQSPRVAYPVGNNPQWPRRSNPPAAPPATVYLLGVGGYYYAAPGDDSAAPPQDGLQPEGQTNPDQAANGANDQQSADQSSDDRAQQQSDVNADANTAASAPDQQDSAQQGPLPDEGTLTLVLRDGSRLDVIAFTLTQGKIIYITPEGLRLTMSASLLDADSTQRLNQERGTPMQLPL
ncbi:MAG: hypothetical protein WA192_15800 [Candidatus Acidiferrales bacterium]